MIKEVRQHGYKSLVFTSSLAAVEMISPLDLEQAGVDNLVMTGASGNCQKLVHRFESDSTIGAFFMTLETRGVGLNLTAADYVFIYVAEDCEGHAAFVERSHDLRGSFYRDRSLRRTLELASFLFRIKLVGETQVVAQQAGEARRAVLQLALDPSSPKRRGDLRVRPHVLVECLGSVR